MAPALKSKLTLWVDKATVRFGKELARRQHESLSGLLSDYLIRLRDAGESAPLTPMVRRLNGVIKTRRQDREDYRKHLEKKYLGS